MAPKFATTAAFALSVLTSSVHGHGYVSSIKADGVSYSGWNPAYMYSNPIPAVPGWAASNLDNGFVPTTSYGAADIICHKSATPGQAYVNVKAGSTISLSWNTWPNSHVGPVLDYLASCGTTGCTTIDKTTLSFVKLDQGAWKSGYNPGNWVTDDLIANNFTWTTKVPSTLKTGTYVLRHEIIALHAAGSVGGAQAYPQCINLNVTGTGSTTISGGVSATTFYKDTDPGILFDVYSVITSYTIPGPAVWSQAASKLRRYVAGDWKQREE